MTAESDNCLPLILTVKDVAALCQVSEWTVYDWAKHGKLPGCRKIGGSLRVHRDRLLTWLETGQGT